MNEIVFLEICVHRYRIRILAGLMDTAPCKAMFLLSYDVCEVADVVVVVVAMLESTTEPK
jgi:hypothetical protein